MSWDRKREEWRKARDDSGIKKGSISGVSMGDAIDKVVKAEAKGYGSVIAAAEALKAAAKKYQAGLKKLKPTKDLSGWIDKHLVDAGNRLITDATADIKTVDDIHDIARDSTELHAIVPDVYMVQRADAAMKKDPSLSWLDALKNTTEFKMVIAVAKDLSRVTKAVKDAKFRLDMGEKHHKTITAFGKALDSDIKVSVAWVTSKTRDEFFDAAAAARGRQWARDFQDEFAQALKALKA